MIRTVLVFLLCGVAVLAVTGRGLAAADLDRYLDDEDIETAMVQEEAAMTDPLEGVNRLFFAFNDKLYFVVLKPLARLYGAMVPRDLRLCVRNFFVNLAAPVRMVNSFLQGKLRDSGVELVRFAYNTTVGVGGLADAAATDLGLTLRDEDLGQTLGRYGARPGWYFCWPFLGPSSLRDSIGLVGDFFLNPLNYLDVLAVVAARSGEMVNHTSLTVGEYESFKEAALDPYVAMRQAYQEYRRAKVEDRHADDAPPMQPTAATERRSFAVAGYAVSVSVTIDRRRAEVLATRLREHAVEPRIVVHDRGDYVFYGVEVPVNGSFRRAKKRELALAALGFTESRVVARREQRPAAVRLAAVDGMFLPEGGAR